MPAGWLWGLISISATVLFVSGYLVAVGIYKPDVSSLEAQTKVQREELSSLQGRLSVHDDRLAALATELSSSQASTVELETSLESTQTFLTEARRSSESALADLQEARSDLSSLKETLEEAQSNKADLSDQVRALENKQGNLDSAIVIHSELQKLYNDELGPNHGDALLLIQEGQLAITNSNYNEAAIFFDESSKAFDLAKINAQMAVDKNENLLELLPSGLHLIIDTSHRQSKATVLAMAAQSREYKGASALYTIIGEWSDLDEKSPAEDIERWRGIASDAEDLLEEAMTKLDEADGWAPGLWRRSEAIRMDIRQWRDLLAGVEVVILDPV